MDSNIPDAEPAEIEHDPVDAFVLLDRRIARNAESIADVASIDAARGLDPIGELSDIVDLEPDVMQTDERRSPLGPSGAIVEVLEYRQADRAIGEYVPESPRRVDRAHARKVEGVDIELRSGIRVVGRNRTPSRGGRRTLRGSAVECRSLHPRVP